MPEDFKPEDFEDDIPVPDEDVGDRFLHELKEGEETGEHEKPLDAPTEVPDFLDNMDTMEEAAQAESPDVPPSAPSNFPVTPESAVEEPSELTDAPDSPVASVPDPPPIPFASTVQDMQQMGDAAVAESGPDSPPKVVADFEKAASATEAEAGRTPTQIEQVDDSLDDQKHQQFEFDVGAFEADQGGMDYLDAETAYRETNYAWQRLMTQMVIDHQHRLEQLLAMLERER